MKTKTIILMALLALTSIIAKAQEEQNGDSAIVKSLKNAQMEIKRIEEEFDNSVISKLTDLNEIKSRIVILANNSTLTSTEVKELTVLTNKKVLIEDELFHKNRLSNVNKLQTRYETGFSILKAMLLQLENLDSKYKDLKLYKTYSNIANPLQYREFNNNLSEIENTLKRKKGFDITLPSPLSEIVNKNPTIASGYSIVTAVLSTLSAPVKSEKFKTIRDVLILTGSMQTDLNLINNEIDYLEHRVSLYLRKTETFFSEYLKSIEYTKSYAQFITDNDNQTIENMKGSVFTGITNDINNNINNYTYSINQTEKEIEITFNLIRLVDLINEYKIVLSETENYYMKFETMIKKYDNQLDFPELNVNATLQSGNTFKDEVTKLKIQLVNAKDSAQRVLKASDVSEYEIRKILYGTPRN